MRLAAFAPFLRRWPLFGLAAVLLLIALAVLLKGDPEPAQAQSADVTEPVLVVGNVKGNILTLYFNEDLDFRSAP